MGTKKKHVIHLFKLKSLCHRSALMATSMKMSFFLQTRVSGPSGEGEISTFKVREKIWWKRTSVYKCLSNWLQVKYIIFVFFLVRIYIIFYLIILMVGSAFIGAKFWLRLIWGRHLYWAVCILTCKALSKILTSTFSIVTAATVTSCIKIY